MPQCILGGIFICLFVKQDLLFQGGVIVAHRAIFGQRKNAILEMSKGITEAFHMLQFEIEYYDSGWKKLRQKYSGWTVQIMQYECDYLEGIII